MKHKKILNDIKILLLFTLYMYALFKIILFKFGSIHMRFLWQQLKLSIGSPDYISRQFHKGNLIPFNEISRTIHDLSSHGLINLIGNFVIFIPFGILLGLMLRNGKISYIGVFTLSLGLSLILESAQALFSIGSFDVDDLILNSSGGLTGFIIFKFSTRFVAANHRTSSI
ncbi:VanZ family protein [Paenibacillus eucommiae]|uniref:Glycopeptide antibiotics resistance protein n=1 Tax=Paenibacillus eucommiae TaxID=1355755 RepID=A0ABS4IQH8_9BACL|nr:VanZ family protein [Paenibacillus eucommiae]MBP1989828.1 glycopeptide antibiotics resistance protein [Paenibacillus eucommiae]